MKTIFQTAGLLILAVSIGLCGQKNPRPKTPPQARPRAAAKIARSEARGGPHINVPLNPGQRFLNMTAEEQDRVLEKATPAQRQRMLQARERWLSLSPAQRDFVARQYQSLAKLPPSQQVLVTRQMNAFNQLPVERRRPVRMELIQLLRMPADQRPTRLASEDFTGKYSAGEQGILRDLSTNLPEDYPIAGK
jgi:hypothetical protein